MTILKQSSADALVKSPYESTEVREYAFGSPNLDLAVTTIKGRYPEAGWALNEVSTELVLILEGTGTLHTPQRTYEFTKDDSLMIPAGAPYAWSGEFKASLTCHPAWAAAQHKIIDAR